ncbi:phage baseplate assembly protein V [Flavobacterium sp.]|uniref:phage baseplate assembly protein V n=1 Tax=Flavobacterium sp. TaxID=239 RepID=UPI00286BD84B|nr:phage baseplate assembly protein V [Flavobacterium sp.]
MAAQPFYPSETLLKLKFLIAGNDSGLDSLLKEATVHFELNKIAFAKFTFIASNDGLEKQSELPLDVLNRKPQDKPIEIEVQIPDTDIAKPPKTLFKGIVKSFEKQTEATQITVKIECKDIAFRLTQPSTEPENNTMNFEERLKLFIDGKLKISDNLKGKPWGKEKITHNNATVPWDYLVGYLDSIGLLISLRNAEFNAVGILKEDGEKTASYMAENGINVFSFSGKVDAQKQKSSVVIESWDIEAQAVNRTSAEQSTDENPQTIRVGQTHLTADTLKRIAEAVLVKSNIAAINGKVTTFGNLEAKAGDYISFSKVNPQIDDKILLITQETHMIENGCWKTEYAYGLESEKSFTEQTAAPAHNNSQAQIGQSNTVNGLQIGKVLQIEDDPDHHFRIRVKITSLSESGEGVWARLANANASKDMGSYFIPDVGDEVILGCIGNNPDTPVILGSLYSSAHPMPFPIKKENYFKGFVTKQGTRILMDDEKKIIEISTKKANKLTISDDLKGVAIEDENGNKITLNDQGIVIESFKDISIKAASGNIKIEGKQVEVTSSTKMDLKGSLINLN